MRSINISEISFPKFFVTIVNCKQSNSNSEFVDTGFVDSGFLNENIASKII